MGILGNFYQLLKDSYGVLKKEKVSISVIAGSIIPEKDVGRLKKAGIREVFKFGESLESIVGFIKV